MIKTISLKFILPHPDNANRMDSNTLSKLKRHIERTGRYEPVIVRPSPAQKDYFQLINGHHRMRVLKALGHTTAECIVWDVDDEQARLYLATLNRLKGEDVPERRAVLIGSLLEKMTLEELEELLPEDRDQLTEMERLARIDLKEIETVLASGEKTPPQIILEFFLKESEAQEVNLALDLVAHRNPSMTTRSGALVQLARSYIAVKKSARRRDALYADRNRGDSFKSKGKLLQYKAGK